MPRPKVGKGDILKAVRCRDGERCDYCKGHATHVVERKDINPTYLCLNKPCINKLWFP